MLAFDEVHGNYNMPSQLKLHPINNKPSDFTFCHIPKRKHHQEHHEGFSPPLWSNNLPSSSNCTVSSSSNKTMVEGRNDLMEMINDLPESWYELSLKDMVADEDPDDSGLVIIEDKVDMSPKLKGKKKCAKRGPISRSVSLDTGVFLLKMFVPSSFGSKKHMVSRSRSIDGLKKHHDDDDDDVIQRKTRFIVENKSNISSRSYKDNRCWFKSTNHKWCIFF